MTSATHDMRLGQALVAGEILTEQQLDQALTEQEKSGQPLAEILFEDEKVNTLQVLRILAGHLNVPYCQLRHGLIDFSLLELIGEEEAERFGVIPLFKVHDTLTVAMTQPQLLPNVDRLRELTGCKIRPVLAPGPNIREYIKKVSIGSSDIDSFLSSLSDSDVEVVEKESVDEGEATNLDKMVEGSPIINLVNMAMLTAIRDKASDIHIDPEKNGTRIRYRIDGKLYKSLEVPLHLLPAVTSRIKIMASLDISERRLPQDGRVNVMLDGHRIDLRVSLFPGNRGEKTVIRVLDTRSVSLNLESLGFAEDILKDFQTNIRAPNGIVLVTGPTGSGKSTTLYSALSQISSMEINICTVEDPIEYHLPLINQFQVQERVGMTFPKALRTLLRQDPDIIMVGEIRDEETARTAIQAALTGHLVFSTLHTNDACSAVTRLVNMGVEPYLIGAALNMVLAQRLVRRICPKCRETYEPPRKLRKAIEKMGHRIDTYYKGVGCKRCRNTGFSGRIGVHELLVINDQLRDVIVSDPSIVPIRNIARDRGMVTLQHDGFRKVREGITTVEEIMHISGEFRE
ncbi:MAG: Flp pilus assembly complex ATPase component TadA [Planctomycetes bacterium]|nr:Flp pilus assembly complex ATPase component TadA [Planctomycetota bacterium]